MSHAKKIIVAVSPESNIEELLSPISEMSFRENVEIQFVNVFTTIKFTHWLNNSSLVYPIESDRKEIEVSTIKKINEIASKVLPSDFKGKFSSKCLFGEIPKDVLTEYINNEKPDLVIIAKRQKKGLFESSFARHINNHTQSNMLILKRT